MKRLNNPTRTKCVKYFFNAYDSQSILSKSGILFKVCPKNMINRTNCVGLCSKTDRQTGGHLQKKKNDCISAKFSLNNYETQGHNPV